MKALLIRLGELMQSVAQWTGGVARLFWVMLLRGPKQPVGLEDIAYQIIRQGVMSGAIATLVSGFIGMILAWQFGDALMDFNAKQALGNTSAIALVRELVPATLAITAGAKMAAGMAAELGSMKVTEQIDAIAALGADPIKKLVWPRVVSSMTGLPLLTVWGNMVAMLGGMFIADSVFDVPAMYFYQTYVEELAPIDYLGSIIKATVFGAIVGTIGCYHGFNTKFGTEAVGHATTETVVATSICVIVADFLLTMMFVQL